MPQQPLRYICSDRAPGIVYFGYWFGTVGKYYTRNSLQTVVRGSLDCLVGCHEGFPPLLVAASGGDTRQSGS